MRRMYEKLILVLEGYSAVLMLSMLVVVLLGVFFRYIVDRALSWYDEFAEFVLVWLTMYGSVVALARRKHIGFEALVEKLPAGVQRATEIFAALCVLGFSVILVVSSWVLVRAMAAETAVSIPEVKMAWVYSVLPISGALMVLISLVQIIQLLIGRSGPDLPRPEGLEEGQ
ncbi:MAG TPA: TRAP transporter small permease [Candidatus Methylomirabilis sp.]|nr:TRAP transporter small permease [Candidatus Methylomirabilis sp.]HSD50486.1 TRAP transporter small permease [Candidatus Methylomirabilis sp.]